MVEKKVGICGKFKKFVGGRTENAHVPRRKLLATVCACFELDLAFLLQRAIRGTTYCADSETRRLASLGQPALGLSGGSSALNAGRIAGMNKVY